MLKGILQFSIKQRWLILVAVLIVICLGIYNYTRLSIDAVPDITNIQVQINTEAVGYTPLEVEQRITYPIEIIMSGLPKLDYTRSLSRYGLSQVTVIFKEGTDIYFARQLISQRLQAVNNKLPEGINPMMGPISTGLGEIYMYKLTTSKPEKYTPTKLRTIQDWIVRPQLRNVPGVAEVNAIGGYTKQYQVSPDLKKLIQFGLTLEDIENALKKNNDNVGAGYIEKKGQQFLMRAPGQLKTNADIERVVVKTIDGVAIRIADIADVTIGHELRQGAGLAAGSETVIGTVAMIIGENSRIVAEDIHNALQKINETLPHGVKAVPVYNRMNLVNATIKTVTKNLTEGALLVIVVLFLFLGNFRAALITALVIPITMLMTISGMVPYDISANLMSLGALDFGLIVDGAVIIVENCIKKLSWQQHSLKRKLTLQERLNTVLDSANEVIRPSLFGVLIITIVYFPILTLTGVEGKMFRPMAQTVIIALLSSIILSMTFVPASISIALPGRISEKSNRIVLFFRNIYKPALLFCFKNRVWVILLSLGLVVASLLLAINMGGEFIPSLDEGDITLHALRTPSTSLSQSIDMQKHIETIVERFPEVKLVYSKIGTPDVATDPMPPNVADTFVILKPRAQWPNPDKPKAVLIKEIKKELAKEPGNKYEFTQPIQMRFNELISGIRSDVAIKIYGDDLNKLLLLAKEVFKVVNPVEGAADTRIEQASGLPTITIRIDRKKLALYGLNMLDVQNAVETALSGRVTGLVYQGDQRFELVIRLKEKERKEKDILSKIFIKLPPKEDGIKHFILLSEVASLDEKLGPNQISRENGKRRIFVSTNVRGRDLRSFVDEIQTRIKNNVNLPAGYWIDYGGEFEQMTSAVQRLTFVVPVTLLLIFVLLFMALQSLHDAIVVFSGIPLALTGGIFSLWIRGIPLSISAGVGFIALSGIAVLNGLVMISFITNLRKRGNTLVYSIIRGALARLRPVLMTALVASLGFVPMALSTGTGAEVQKPLATVVIGGILSSTFLTLLVLPGLYFWVHKSFEQ
ncbi:CusA/CzcA family heavy metal efflux RND transporter [Legionella israelensis]|uniref:CusA/CzcA family heavy metal efflux RND transporter n=1 Tax=Legionella israelensis TaxID=454 RepID=A0AAX1EFG8_9GAMM|nr:CusA/CzcA family heavy metal efflux RND transporter [Legionella israelensis]QBR83782.1 CusA/CzcA family heavy metal efflux RND transporter [Legionella israelensis]